MRILHLLKHCNASNGHVNVAVDLACTHAAAGHAVAMATAGGDYVGFLAAHGVSHTALAYGRSPMTLLASLSRLAWLCVRFKPDVIHAHMMSSAVFGFVVSRLLGVPLVTTVHNSFDRHSGLMRLGDAVAAVSEAERRLLLGRGYPERKLMTIRNGTVGSPRDSIPAGRDLPPLRTPGVMTICGLHARKGVHHLLDAFAQIAARHPDWHLNIVGRGPDEPLLKARVRTLELADRVHFIGGTPNPHPLLRQAEIFALASLAEPFGLVLVEARAAGCAVVSSDVGGTGEALGFGAAGQLVPPADPAAMAAVLAGLMSDPPALAAWRRRAGENLGDYRVERMADSYLALYQTLVPSASVSTRQRFI